MQSSVAFQNFQLIVLLHIASLSKRHNINTIKKKQYYLWLVWIGWLLQLQLVHQSLVLVNLSQADPATRSRVHISVCECMYVCAHMRACLCVCVAAPDLWLSRVWGFLRMYLVRRPTAREVLSMEFSSSACSMSRTTQYGTKGRVSCNTAAVGSLIHRLGPPHCFDSYHNQSYYIDVHYQ